MKGVIDTVPHAEYYVSYKSATDWVLDTISLDVDRRFEIRGVIDEPSVLIMRIKNNYNPNFVGDFEIYRFWVEPGKTVLFEGYKNWLTNGAKGLVRNRKARQVKNSVTEEIASKHRDRLDEALREYKRRSGKQLNDRSFYYISDSVATVAIKESPDNYHSLSLLRGLIGKFLTDYKLIEGLFGLFPESLKNTNLGLEIQNNIVVNGLTAIGRVLPDFEQRDTSGNPVSLSDFRGKYVLVDFWASWCGPCRKEHPHLVKAYADYKSSGFEILGISLDGSKNAWLKAIHDDGLTWAQLSDLKGGFDNDVARQFFIHAVPDNFLLDPNGVIIARGLKGTELLTKLENVFKK